MPVYSGGAPTFLGEEGVFIGLLDFFTSSRTVLPYKTKSFKFYRDVERQTKYFCITQKITSGEETNTYDLKLVDKNGNLFIAVDSFEMIKLNRLDPTDQIIDRVEFTRLDETEDPITVR